MDERVLIVNADDFGLSPGVNAGVVQAHEDGVLTSASLMIRSPAAMDAVALAADHPGLSLGLHVDLGEWVLRDGSWETVYEVVPMNDQAKLQAEVWGQMEWFRQKTGRYPTHIDSHQHVHVWEPGVAVFTQLARQMSIPLRHCTTGIRYCGDLYGHDSTGNLIADAITVDNLIEIIASLQPGVTELACHPGVGGDSGSPYDRERAEELKILCDPRVRDALEREGVTLRSFAEIAARDAA